MTSRETIQGIRSLIGDGRLGHLRQKKNLNHEIHALHVMFSYLVVLALIITTVSSLNIGGRIFRSSKLAMATDASFYGVVEKDGKGQPFPFEKLRGKVVYGVNVASKCGYTASGYALLEKVAAMSVSIFVVFDTRVILGLCRWSALGTETSCGTSGPCPCGLKESG